MRQLVLVVGRGIVRMLRSRKQNWPPSVLRSRNLLPILGCVTTCKNDSLVGFSPKTGEWFLALFHRGSRETTSLFVKIGRGCGRGAQSRSPTDSELITPMMSP